MGSGQSLTLSSQSNRKRRRRPFESGGQNFESLGAPPGLAGPACFHASAQRNRERKPPNHTEAILALLAHDTGRDRQGPL